MLPNPSQAVSIRPGQRCNRSSSEMFASDFDFSSEARVRESSGFENSLAKPPIDSLAGFVSPNRLSFRSANAISDRTVGLAIQTWQAQSGVFTTWNLEKRAGIGSRSVLVKARTVGMTARFQGATLMADSTKTIGRQRAETGLRSVALAAPRAMATTRIILNHACFTLGCSDWPRSLRDACKGGAVSARQASRGLASLHRAVTRWHDLVRGRAKGDVPRVPSSRTTCNRPLTELGVSTPEITISSGWRTGAEPGRPSTCRAGRRALQATGRPVRKAGSAAGW